MPKCGLRNGNAGGRTNISAGPKLLETNDCFHGSEMFYESMTFSPPTLASEVDICCWDPRVNWKFPWFFLAEAQTHSTHSSKGMKSSQTSSVLHVSTLLSQCLQLSDSFTSGSRNEHEIPPHPFLFQASSSQGLPAIFCSEPSRHELQRRCELTGWHLLTGSCDMEVAMISTKLRLWIGKHGYFAKESDRFKFQ